MAKCFESTPANCRLFPRHWQLVCCFQLAVKMLMLLFCLTVSIARHMSTSTSLLLLTQHTYMYNNNRLTRRTKSGASAGQVRAPVLKVRVNWRARRQNAYKVWFAFTLVLQTKSNHSNSKTQTHNNRRRNSHAMLATVIRAKLSTAAAAAAVAKLLIYQTNVCQ